ncbi:MAG: hypothetical protein WB809_05950 [Thermoplasmata archaeon]
MPRRAILHGASGTLLLLPTLDREGRPTHHGVWLARGVTQWVGPRPAPSLLAESARLVGATADLVNLLQGAARSYLEGLEALSERLDAIEIQGDAVPLAELTALHRKFRALRKYQGSLTVVIEELDGPLGERFPNLEGVLPRLESELSHLQDYSSAVGQSLRDLLALRTAGEANRLSVATNELSRVSNQIAGLANTSNIRMLGVAYIAFVLALVSVVVLIPNTAATILGMPSAAWVPGLWVDVILVVLAILPLAVVFSRPWVRNVLAGLGSFEARTQEGLKDLPEVRPVEVNRPGEERLLERSP